MAYSKVWMRRSFLGFSTRNLNIPRANPAITCCQRTRGKYAAWRTRRTDLPNNILWKATDKGWKGKA
jgi:hypothetical protein